MPLNSSRINHQSYSSRTTSIRSNPASSRILRNWGRRSTITMQTRQDSKQSPQSYTDSSLIHSGKSWNIVS